MDKSYKENWDFYFTQIEDSPVSVFVDLGLNRVLPVAENPFVLTMFIEMLNPLENGFCTKEESEELFKIEDRITPLLVNKSGAIFAGRMTYDGDRVLYYYLKTKDGAKKSINAAMAEFPDYSFSVNIEDDPEWEYYTDDLYPRDYELHTIMNRHIVQNMKEHGDNGSLPREVNHFIYFKEEAGRKNFADEAVKMGYEIASMHIVDDSKEFPLSLIIKRYEPVKYDEVNDTTSLLYDMAEDNGGRYDGWETMIVQDRN
ncbi:MAG: Regulator of ribonuclease activity B [Chlorobi bacterium OLB5]|nr:MAG: Regulator of ribonuclease activity B [Chlorobi bacterium OLB5]